MHWMSAYYKSTAFVCMAHMFVWIERNGHVFAESIGNVLCGDVNVPISNYKRRHCVNQTHTKNGYKNDLHTGKTVDNVLFVTRQTTYASKNRKKNEIRTKTAWRSRELFGKKTISDLYTLCGCEWEWYIHDEIISSGWWNCTWCLAWKAIVTMWMHLGIITQMETLSTRDILYIGNNWLQDNKTIQPEKSPSTPASIGGNSENSIFVHCISDSSTRIFVVVLCRKRFLFHFFFSLSQKRSLLKHHHFLFCWTKVKDALKRISIGLYRWNRYI